MQERLYKKSFQPGASLRSLFVQDDFRLQVEQKEATILQLNDKLRLALAGKRTRAPVWPRMVGWVERSDEAMHPNHSPFASLMDVRMCRARRNGKGEGPNYQ